MKEEHSPFPITFLAKTADGYAYKSVTGRGFYNQNLPMPGWRLHMIKSKVISAFTYENSRMAAYQDDAWT